MSYFTCHLSPTPIMDSRLVHQDGKQKPKIFPNTKNYLNLPKIKPSFSQPLLALRPLIRGLESTGMPCFQGGRT